MCEDFPLATDGKIRVEDKRKVFFLKLRLWPDVRIGKPISNQIFCVFVLIKA